MKIFLIGASGPTGLLVLQYLLNGKHLVKTLVRSPEKLGQFHDNNLTIIKGDVFHEETYDNAVKGCDMVISVLGVGKSLKSNQVYSKGGEHIVNVMKKADVNKLLVVTSDGVQHDDPAQKQSWFYYYILRWLLQGIYKDMKLLEELLERTPEINWIIVRPTYLAEGKLTGNYKVGKNYSAGNIKISREDLADFIVKQVSSDEYIHQKPVLSY